MPILRVLNGHVYVYSTPVGYGEILASAPISNGGISLAIKPVVCLHIQSRLHDHYMSCMDAYIGCIQFMYVAEHTVIIIDPN
jgi:hypothetical protein